MPLGTTTNIDRDTYPLRGDQYRQEHNLLANDVMYLLLNRGSADSPPGNALATNTARVKTANTTKFLAAGVPKSVAAADPMWTLTGGVLAALSFRKYLLLHDGTTATVLASTDSLVSAAACTFAARPANGKTILGTLTVATAVATTFTPDTTLLGAAGITATITDGLDGSVFLAASTLALPALP
jgi:hypothetical protein